MNSLKNALSSGNLLAVVAVFLALGGGAFAATKIAKKNSVTSRSIKDAAVTGKDVKDDSLTGADVDEATLQLKGAENGPSTPTGPAGGDLDGTYPSPEIAANAVTSAEILDESVTGADIKSDSVTSTDVQDSTLDSVDVVDDSLTGTDVREASLDEVPVARLGGTGRYGFTGSCDPESGTFEPCSVTQMFLPNASRVLVIGTALAHVETGSTREGYAFCRIGTTSGPVEASTVGVHVSDTDEYENLTVNAVTDVFPSGTHSFGIDCNEASSKSGVDFLQARVTAVALSAD